MEILRPDQIEAAAKTLAEAFWDDPLMHIVAPNENKRAAVGPWFFSKSIAYGIRWGEASCNDDASAVAIWFPPGNTDITPGRMLRVGMGAVPCLSLGPPRPTPQEFPAIWKRQPRATLPTTRSVGSMSLARRTCLASPCTGW